MNTALSHQHDRNEVSGIFPIEQIVDLDSADVVEITEHDALPALFRDEGFTPYAVDCGFNHRLLDDVWRGFHMPVFFHWYHRARTPLNFHPMDVTLAQSLLAMGTHRSDVVKTLELSGCSRIESIVATIMAFNILTDNKHGGN